MEVLRVAILDFCRRRQPNSFCPSEVIRQMYPVDWRFFMSEIQEVMMEMYREGLLVVTQNGIPVDPKLDPKGPVRISCSQQLNSHKKS